MAEIQARLIAKQNNTPGVAPRSNELEKGELAVNTADGKLFTKHADGSIITLNDSVLIKNEYLDYRGFEYGEIDPAGAGSDTLILPIPTHEVGDTLVATFFAVFTDPLEAPILPAGWQFFAEPGSSNQSINIDANPRTASDPRYQSMWLAYKVATSVESGTINITVENSNRAQGSIISLSAAGTPEKILNQRSTLSTESINATTFFTSKPRHVLALSHWVVTSESDPAITSWTGEGDLRWLTSAQYAHKRYDIGYYNPGVSATPGTNLTHNKKNINGNGINDENSTHCLTLVSFNVNTDASGLVIESPVTSVNNEIGDVSLGVSNLNDVDVAPALYKQYDSQATPVTGAPGEWDVSGNYLNFSSFDSLGKSAFGSIQGLNPGDDVWISSDGSAWVTRTVASSPVTAGDIGVLEITAPWTPLATSLYISDVDPTSTTPGAVGGDVLMWNEVNQVWESGKVATPVSFINDLNDVDTETVAPQVNDLLTWDGTQWTPGVPDSNLGVVSINGLTGAVDFGTNQLNDYNSVRLPETYLYHNRRNGLEPTDAGQWSFVSATEYWINPFDTDLVDRSSEYSNASAGDPLYLSGDDSSYQAGVIAATPQLQVNGYYRVELESPGLVDPATNKLYVSLGNPQDVIPSIPTEGQTMSYDAERNYWRPGLAVPTTIDQLENVILDQPADGQGLVWDEARGRWKNGQTASIIELVIEKDGFDLYLTGPGIPQGDPSDFLDSEQKYGGMWLIPGTTYQVFRGEGVEPTDILSIKPPFGDVNNVPFTLYNPAGDGEALQFTVPTSVDQPKFYQLSCGNGSTLRLPILKPHDGRQVANAWGTFTVREGFNNYSMNDMVSSSFNIQDCERMAAGIFKVTLNSYSIPGRSEIGESDVFMNLTAPIATPMTESTDPFDIRDWRVSIFEVNQNNFKVSFYDRDLSDFADPDVFSVVVFGGGQSDISLGRKVEMLPAFFRTDL